jgi:predicted ester cyclase
MTASQVSAVETAPAAEAAIAIFRQAIERGWNQGDRAAIDELFAADHIEHQVGIEPGREGVKGSIGYLRSAFPDLHLTLEAVVAAGDQVWARISATGTHKGPFMGTPASGRSFRIDVIDIVRVVDGRIVEHWGVADRLSLVQQLGVVPAGPR